MAIWKFTTRTVAEAPFAWNPLMERFRMDRGISVKEISPCQYEEVRYDAYTNELGSKNLPRDTAYQSQEFYKPLNFFRGGYEHLVDDATKACLIDSGVADESNFILDSGVAPNYAIDLNTPAEEWGEDPPPYPTSAIDLTFPAEEFDPDSDPVPLPETAIDLTEPAEEF